MLAAGAANPRSALSYPERTGAGPPVELRFNLGSQSYALEHTQIEAFAGQIHRGEEFAQFIRPVVGTLSGQLPGPAVYSLYFPVDTRLHMKASRREQVRRDFIAWVRENAQRLHERNPAQPTRERNPYGMHAEHRDRPPGSPYEVRLRREAHWARSQRHHGVLLVSRIVPEDVEELRATRLRQALDRKCPKLARCKDEGAKTVLILEDGGIALPNHVLIGDGLAGLLAHRNNLPDEIYLVKSALDTWTVRRMKQDDDMVPEEVWHEFESAELADITGAGEVQGR